MFWELALFLFKQMKTDLEKKEIYKLELDEMWHYVKKKEKIMDLDCL